MAQETEIIDAILRGLADMQAGRLIPHDAAMAEVDAAIDESASVARTVLAARDALDD